MSAASPGWFSGSSRHDSRKRLRDPEAALKRNKERLQDEVYRQVFRLEAHRQDAELDLSVALLRAWQAAAGVASQDDEWQWLKNICPICIKMIETARRKSGKDSPSIQ